MANKIEIRIEQLDSRSVQVVPNKSTAQTLREIADTVGFKLDPKWDSFQIGAKLIDFINDNSDADAKVKNAVKKSALVNLGKGGRSRKIVEFRIEQLDSRSVQVVPNKSTAQTLREIADIVDFKLDPKWDSFQIGSKLIDFINQNDGKNAKLKDEVKKAAVVILTCKKLA